jgi:glucosamine--fructose-6-phosphate aminotransferase (isomerizing)
MYKEILDQPEAVSRTLGGRLDRQFHTAHLGGLNLEAGELLDVKRVKLLGCGSAYYAGITGAHLIESLARIPASAEPAAEFRYRNPVIERDTLYVAVSQSGETIDTSMAVQEVRRCGGRVLGIVNVVGSSIAREADGGIYMHAGPEVAVASTKAYTCSLVALALLALQLGRSCLQRSRTERKAAVWRWLGARREFSGSVPPSQAPKTPTQPSNCV